VLQSRENDQLSSNYGIRPSARAHRTTLHRKGEVGLWSESTGPDSPVVSKASVIEWDVAVGGV